MIFNARLLQASFLSGLIHLFIFGSLAYLSQLSTGGKTSQIKKPAQNVRIINQEQLARYKRLGVKGGSKKFSIPVKSKSSVSKNKTKYVSSSVTKKDAAKNADSKKLDLKSLQAKVDEVDPDQFNKNSKDTPKNSTKQSKTKEQARRKLEQLQNKTLIKQEIASAENGLPLTSLRSKQATQNFRRQNTIQRDMMSQLGTNSTASEVLDHAGFNLHFEPPEGFSEDELNSVEKTFFSFQKRTFLGYVNSFISTYKDMILQRPQLRTALTHDRHLLTGKVTFDQLGNIVRIKILRSSRDDTIHELFEQTLREIGTLPNPPKAFLEKKNEFTIYYQLSINGN